MHFSNVFGNVIIRCLSIDLDIVCYGFRSFTAGNIKCKCDLFGNIGKGDFEFSVFNVVNNSRRFGNSPCKFNFGIFCSFGRKRYNGVFRSICENIKIFFFDLDLFRISFLKFGKIFKSVYICRDKIERTAVKLNDTGYVCSPCGMICVTLFESCDLIRCKTVVGRGDSYISLFVSEFELVITVRCVLCCYFNIIDRYKYGLFGNECRIGKSFRICVDIRVIKGFNFFDLGIYYRCCCAYNFVQAVICVFNAGNVNGHTDCDTEICYGIFGKIVNVIAAVIVYVLQIKRVCARSAGFGYNTHNDTFNNDRSVVFGSGIFFVCEYGICGDRACECFNNGSAAFALNGCGKSVSYFFLCFFVNVDRVKTLLGAFFDRNIICVVRCPFYAVGSSADHYFADNIKVGIGDRTVVFVKTEQIFACFFNARICSARNKCGQA